VSLDGHKNQYKYVAMSEALAFVCWATIETVYNMAAIETERKKPVFADEGHMYRFDRRSADNGKFWRCLVDGCNGRIKTDANDVFIEFRNTELN